MDPAAAIGLASSIITFIDFSCKVVAIANELYESNNGLTKENARIHKVISDLRESSLGLKVNTGSSSKQDVALQDLAKECESISGELIAILEKLKLAGQSKRERLKKAFSSQQKRKEISSLEARLGEYRNQMSFRLLCLLSEETSTTKQQLDVVQAASKELSCASATRLGDIRQDIISRLSSLRDPSLLHEINEKLESLQAVFKSTDRETRILEHLHFETIYAREDLIEDAPYETFRWILKDSNRGRISLEVSSNAGCSSSEWIDFGDHDDLSIIMNAARELLQNWLSSGTGVFHVSGKAGSGKSTLMKLLCTHERTRELLQAWAGSRKLVFAPFYFWNAGSELQKSLDGLYRSILFHVLRQCPQLIPKVFPDQWDQLSALHLSSRKLEVDLFRPLHIKKAFDRLIQTSLDSENIGVCLFIDGLDEYNGKAYDHRILAEKICSWAASKEVKICVSSRPHVEFVDTFDKNLRINLHDLTARDITLLACEMFKGSSNFSQVENIYRALVREIASLANGVFLWAHLVLKSVINEMNLGSSYERLREKIQSMPRELDELYDKILGTLEPKDRSWVNLRLLLVLTSPFLGLNNWLYFSGLDISGITVDSEFPSGDHIITFRSVDDYLTERGRITRQVVSLTRGLLVPTRDRFTLSRHPLFQPSFDFFHRTVRDYLETPRRLAELLDEFANIDLLQLHDRLKLVQIVRASSLPDSLKGMDRKNGQIYLEIEMALFTRHLPQNWLLKYFPKHRLPPESWIQHSHTEMMLFRRYCSTLISGGYWNILQGSVEPFSQQPETTPASFLHYAIGHGQIRYAREELRKGVQMQNISSEVFLPAADAAQDLNALLSALLGATNNDLCELMLKNGFSARDNVTWFQLADSYESAPFRQAGTVSIWVLSIFGLLRDIRFHRDFMGHFSILETILRDDPELPGVLLFFLAESDSNLFSLTTQDIVATASPSNAPSLLELLPLADRKLIISERVVEAAARTLRNLRRSRRRNMADMTLTLPSDDKLRQLISRPMPLVEPSKLERFKQWLRGSDRKGYTVLGAASQSELLFGDDWWVRVW